jgi:hypothetical protein
MTYLADGALGERIRSKEVAEAHFVAELRNDPVEILKSMKSYEPLLTTIIAGADHKQPRLLRCATLDEQRAFYAAGRSRANMTRVDLLTSIGSDWYGFVHAVTTWEPVGGGNETATEIVGILPRTPDEDTIAGEVGAGWPVGFGKLGDLPGEVTRERVATVRSHDSWLEALRQGDPRRIGECYSERVRAALRHPFTGEITCLEGRQAVVSYFADLLRDAKVSDLRLAMRVVDRWYIASEMAFDLVDRTRGDRLARVADVCVMDEDNKILVQLATAPNPGEI